MLKIPVCARIKGPPAQIAVHRPISDELGPKKRLLSLVEALSVRTADAHWKS